jgi:beta-barrel assembly-enhancing protease
LQLFARQLCCVLIAMLLVIPPALGFPQSDNPSSSSDFNLPQIGEAGAGSLTPEQEFQAGVQIMDQLRNTGAILDDPLIHEYIDNLGHQLSSHSDNPTLHFEYFVLNDPTVNAVTLPGGFIGVNSGMILASDNEDELAGVMAHETGHVTQRHIARSIEDQKDHSLLDLATILGAILIAARTADPNVAMGTLATAESSIIQHQINFTRSQEAEADRVGIQTLARAGFSPNGMIDFFQKMQRDSALNGYDQIPEFLMDHPLDLTRMSYLKERAESLHVPPKPDSRSYAIMKARLRVLVTDDPGKTRSVFLAGVKSEHGWNQEAMRYGLSLIDTRLNRDAEAISLMQDLETRYEDVTAFHIGLAEAQFAGGLSDQAIATYNASMQLFPGSLPLTLSYAGDLIDAAKPEQAISVLLGLPANNGEGNAEVLRLLAKAYEKAGNIADSHFYMSRYYSMTGLNDQALEQLRIALAVPDISDFQRERYKARMDRVKTELLAEHKNQSRRNSSLMLTPVPAIQ